MKYLTERSLFYYFLMREVADSGLDLWSFTAKNFGVKASTVKAYQPILANPVLDELSSTGDIEMYRNYLNGFCTSSTEFGNARREQDAIDAKALALHKLQELFSDVLIKGNRLRSLSHNYENDHIAGVLYAMQMLFLNGGKQCEKFATEILTKELKEGKNSDAGLILLQIAGEYVEDTVTCLRSLPDILLRPDVLQYLANQYGGSGESVLGDKRTIGF